MSVAAGAGSGAATGATIGSFIPGAGTLIGAGVGAVVGAGFGLAQHGKRKVQGQRNAMRAGLIYEHEKKAKERNRSILEGQLTISAMQNTAQSREAAIQVAQEEGMREVALGQSGMSGGTPFYSLDSEIQQNVQRLSDLLYMQNADLSGRIAQANNQLDGSDMRMQEAIWGMQDANEQMAYLDSDVATALSMATGAFAGITMANNVNTAITQMTGTDIEGHFSGWADAAREKRNWEQPQYGSAHSKTYTPAPSSMFPSTSAPGRQSTLLQPQYGSAYHGTYMPAQSSMFPSTSAPGRASPHNQPFDFSKFRLGSGVSFSF